MVKGTKDVGGRVTNTIGRNASAVSEHTLASNRTSFILAGIGDTLLVVFIKDITVITGLIVNASVRLSRFGIIFVLTCVLKEKRKVRQSSDTLEQKASLVRTADILRTSVQGFTAIRNARSIRVHRVGGCVTDAFGLGTGTRVDHGALVPDGARGRRTGVRRSSLAFKVLARDPGFRVFSLAITKTRVDGPAGGIDTGLESTRWMRRRRKTHNGTLASQPYTYVVGFTRNHYARLELVIIGFAPITRLGNGRTHHARLTPRTVRRRLLDLTLLSCRALYPFARGRRDALGLFGTVVAIPRLHHLASITRGTIHGGASRCSRCLDYVNGKASHRKNQ